MAKFKNEVEIFRKNNGILKTSEAKNLGISTWDLTNMLKAGVIERISRGIYRLTSLPPLDNLDLSIVATRVPHGVICLISALHFHNLTDEIPKKVYLAILPGTEKPRLSYPPIEIFWMTENVHSAGREKHYLDNIPVLVFCIEKTIADCFKHRKKIGLEVAIEALREATRERRIDFIKLNEYARINRVDQIMKPYLDILV